MEIAGRGGDRLPVPRPGLERGRLVARAVVDEVGARAERGGAPLAAAVVARHHHELLLAGRRVLDPGRETGVVRPHEGQRSERLDGDRERLRQRGMLERRILRDMHLDHGEDRGAASAVEDVVLPVLAAVAERLDRPPVLGDREQHGGLRAVVVPDVVVDFLEVPRMGAGGQVESENGGGEQVVARPVLAEDVGRGISRRHVDQAQLLIDRDRIPHRRAAALELGTAGRGAVAGGISGLEVPHDVAVGDC